MYALWAMITMFSGIQTDELDGNNINRIENVLMLTSAARTSFCTLKIWLEPVEVRIYLHQLCYV